MSPSLSYGTLGTMVGCIRLLTFSKYNIQYYELYQHDAWYVVYVNYNFF